MPDPAERLVGRARERARLERALTDAAAGAGGVWLVLGEPGIGKSRLIERVADGAPTRVVWGRAWEAGGAPPFWPWTAALRALRRLGWSPSRPEALAPLLPELGGERVTLPPEDARLTLLDAVVQSLCDAATEEPTAVVLEDLHAADAPSLLLLSLLADAARTAPLLVIASARESELAAAHTEPLRALERSAHLLRLGPLSRDAVAEYVEAALGERGAADALYETTEGHPLYLAEAVRLRRAHGADASRIPPGVHGVIERRLDALGDAAATIRAAAVLGRDVEPDRLAELVEDRSVAQRHLREAVDAALMVEVGDGRLRFAHILVREVAYRALAAEQRRRLHRRAADALASRTPPPWAEVVHHLRAADAPGLADAARAAARDATDRLAFEDAAALLAEAVELDRRAGGVDGAGLLALARAQLLAGDVRAGRDTCLEVAAAARRAGNPELLCEAALAYGSVFVVAAVDHRLAGLLEEALEGLGEADRPLRARALARLAAATQPAPDPEVPFALAREAVAVARRLDDPPTLLATLRSTSSALMDLADPVERLALNREHVALARRLGDPVEQWRGSTRSAFDASELGDREARDAAIDAAVERAEAIGLPHYLWSATALRAMRADHAGRIDEGERLAAEARELAGPDDPNAGTALAFQRVVRLRLQGRFAAMRAPLAELAASTRGSKMGWITTTLLEADIATQLGRPASLDRALLDEILRYGDRSFLTLAGDVAARQGDVDAAVRIEAALARWADHHASYGPYGHALGPPIAATLARLAGALGRADEAVGLFERARANARAVGSPPHDAWIALELADWVADPARADALRAEARALAEAHDLPGIERALESPAASARPRAAFGIERDGETWLATFEGRGLRLDDVKGVRLLARLVAEPGREIHALDLDAEGAAPLVGGDAGEVLDPQARAEYVARAKALRAELPDAEDANDRGRVDAIRRELDFLEAELSAAFGLGGRERRAGSAAEKARVNVQRRLRDAVRRLGKLDEAAAKHVERRLTTGAFCVYEP